MRGIKLRSPSSVLLAITLIALQPWEAAARAKKGDEGGSKSEGQASCTTVYIGGYHGGTADANYIGYDFESGNDANESDPVMFDALIADMCKPLPQEDWVPFLNRGPNSNGRMINIIGQDSGFDDYLWKKFDCPAHVEGDPEEEAVNAIVHRWRRGLAAKRWRRSIARGLANRGVSRRDIAEALAMGSMRRGGGQCEWADWDKGGERTVFSLPALEDSCDPDSMEVGDSKCEQREALWSCNVTDSAALQTKLQEIKKVAADDCFTKPKCKGAPYGEVKCTFSPVPAGKYVTGVELVVNGDRCQACSLAVDMEDGNDGEVCPRFYDVHSCSFEWKTEDTLPKKYSTFEFTMIVNGASQSSPLIATWLGLAMLVMLKHMM